jgi:hypothetical protein
LLKQLLKALLRNCSLKKKEPFPVKKCSGLMHGDIRYMGVEECEINIVYLTCALAIVP